MYLDIYTYIHICTRPHEDVVMSDTSNPPPLPFNNNSRCIHTFQGHRGEISSCQFDWEGGKCITGSIDRTCKIWDVKSGQLMNTLRGMHSSKDVEWM